ncbi:MAG: outer membrane protein transport protein [Pseudomonadota bacterium]
MRCLLGCTATALVLTATNAAGGAFQLNERSAKSQGMSFADSVSGAKDPSYAGFNPAALTKVQGLQMSGNASGVFPISDGETTEPIFNGEPISRDDAPAGFELDTNADRSGFIPANAIGYRLNEDVAIGITVNAPFGLSTENPDNFVGAADGIQSNLLTVNVSPAIAWTVSDKFALGASVNILYLDARLTSTPIALDGDSAEIGYSVGTLIEPLDGTQIGIAYHSGYDFEVNVEAILSPEAPGFLGGLAGQEFDAAVEASLPATFQAGITQEIGENARLSAEFRYIFWSAFDSIDTTLFGITVEDPQNYEDAIFAAVGGEYDLTPTTTLRAGMAWDQSPTVDTTSLADEDLGRTVRVPDADRLWFSVGASHKMELFGFDTELDVAYSYLLALQDPEVVIRAGPFEGTTVEYEGGAHIFSVGGSIRF